jgi:hypothetical protein
MDQKIIVEVKTGESAELERYQRPVLEWLSQNPDNTVIKCNCTIHDGSFKLEFSEFVPKADQIWQPVEFLE